MFAKRKIFLVSGFTGHSVTVWNGKFQKNKFQAMGVAVKKVTCKSHSYYFIS